MQNRQTAGILGFDDTSQDPLGSKYLLAETGRLQKLQQAGQQMLGQLLWQALPQVKLQQQQEVVGAARLPHVQPEPTSIVYCHLQIKAKCRNQPMLHSPITTYSHVYRKKLAVEMVKNHLFYAWRSTCHVPPNCGLPYSASG